MSHFLETPPANLPSDGFAAGDISDARMTFCACEGAERNMQYAKSTPPNLKEPFLRNEALKQILSTHAAGCSLFRPSFPFYSSADEKMLAYYAIEWVSAARYLRNTGIIPPAGHMFELVPNRAIGFKRDSDDITIRCGLDWKAGVDTWSFSRFSEPYEPVQDRLKVRMPHRMDQRDARIFWVPDSDRVEVFIDREMIYYVEKGVDHICTDPWGGPFMVREKDW